MVAYLDINNTYIRALPIYIIQVSRVAGRAGVQASEIQAQFDVGWFANPIFVNGKYPDIMRQKVTFLLQQLLILVIPNF